MLVLVLEAREAAAVVVTLGAGAVIQPRGRSAHLTGEGDLREGGGVVGAPQGGALVAVTALGVRHVLLLLPVQGVLAQARVVLHQLQPTFGVALVLGGGVVVLAVLGAHHPDDFAGFALLRHRVLSQAVGATKRGTATLSMADPRPSNQAVDCRKRPPGWWNGRHRGLKNLWHIVAVERFHEEQIENCGKCFGAGFAKGEWIYVGHYYRGEMARMFEIACRCK